MALFPPKLGTFNIRATDLEETALVLVVARDLHSLDALRPEDVRTVGKLGNEHLWISIKGLAVRIDKVLEIVPDLLGVR
jgi:hypothetical protein